MLMNDVYPQATNPVERQRRPDQGRVRGRPREAQQVRARGADFYCKRCSKTHPWWLIHEGSRWYDARAVEKLRSRGEPR